MTAFDPQPAADASSTSSIDHRRAHRRPLQDEPALWPPIIALGATVAALPFGLGLNVLLPKAGIFTRTPIMWPERLGFASADWVGFITVVVCAIVGAASGFWLLRSSTRQSLRGHAIATLAAYGGLLLLTACLIVILNAVSRV